MGAANEIERKVTVNFDTVDSAVERYVMLRDHLRLLHKKNEAAELAIEEDLEAIEMWLRSKADEIGVESFKTAHGTAYKSLKETYRVEDWETFSHWMVATGNLQCVEKRPAKNAVREIHQDNLKRRRQLEETGAEVPGELQNPVPPGLGYFTEVTMNVLRPKGEGMK